MSNFQVADEIKPNGAPRPAPEDKVKYQPFTDEDKQILIDNKYSAFNTLYRLLGKRHDQERIEIEYFKLFPNTEIKDDDMDINPYVAPGLDVKEAAMKYCFNFVVRNFDLLGLTNYNYYKNYFKLTFDNTFKNKHKIEACKTARYLTAYYLYHYFGYTLKQVAGTLNIKSHTSVIHGLKIEERNPLIFQKFLEELEHRQ